MRHSILAQGALFALSTFLIGGCKPPSNSIDVEKAWARPTAVNTDNQPDHDSAGNRTAVYMTIRNNSGRVERLLGGSTPAADTVEIHWSWIDEKGIMRMRPAQTLEILPNQELVFEPGGYHLMLIGVRPLQAGDSLQLSLDFELIGTRETDVVVGNQDL